MRSSILLFALVGCVVASPAFAQTPAPAAPPVRRNLIPVLALDARGTFARLGQDEISAAGLGIVKTVLPAKGFGLTGGAHIYPIRVRGFALGLGGEAVLARASNEPLNTTTKKPGGVVYHRRLRGISGQVSFNFGHTRGWSYLTVGMGPMSFETYRTTTTTTTSPSTSAVVLDGLRPQTLNFGGGARWFNWDHLALSLDVRYYRTRAALATPNTVARDNKSILVLSAGFSIK
jgi:hypothetical protein